MEAGGVLWTLRWRRTLTVAFAAAVGMAGIAPSAWADDTMPAMPVPVVADVPAAETPDLETVVSDVVDGAMAAATDATVSLATGDTADDGSDTTPDIAPSAAESGAVSDSGASAPVLAAQAGAGNVNVSVRVDSPGDDGSVSQSNVAAMAQAGPASSTAISPKSSSDPATTTAAAAQPSSTSSQQSDASPSTTEAGTWEWTWDCVSPPDVSAPSVRDAEGEPIVWNWTWIWKCAGNPDEMRSTDSQYQTARNNETAIQYQPVNVNVSIRISSPGTNGPVTQSNIAIAVGGPSSSSASGAPAGDAAVHVDVQVAVPSDSAPSGDSSSATESPLASPVEAALSLAGVAARVDVQLVVDTFDASAMACRCTDLIGLPTAWAPVGPCRGVRDEVLRGSGPLRGDEWFERCFDAPVVVSPCRCLLPGGVGAGGEAGSAAPGSRTEPTASSGSPRAKTLRPKQVRQGRSAPAPIPIGVSGAALGAAPAGSSSGSVLPFSLLIPLVVALFDLCRRVAVTEATLPSGLAGGTFDPPG
jgi:hypothetical protein